MVTLRIVVLDGYTLNPGDLDWNALVAMPRQRMDGFRQHRPIGKLILDMDSSVSPAYRQQESTAYNGHFGCECYPSVPVQPGRGS